MTEMQSWEKMHRLFVRVCDENESQRFSKHTLCAIANASKHECVVMATIIAYRANGANASVEIFCLQKAVIYSS
jgi:hypothetical protein